MSAFIESLLSTGTAFRPTESQRQEHEKGGSTQRVVDSAARNSIPQELPSNPTSSQPAESSRHKFPAWRGKPRRRVDVEKVYDTLERRFAAPHPNDRRLDSRAEPERVFAPIQQEFICVAQGDKRPFLLELLKSLKVDGDTPNLLLDVAPAPSQAACKILVFMHGERRSDRWALELTCLGFQALSLNQARTEEQIQRITDNFKASENLTVLVCTNTYSQEQLRPLRNSVDFLIYFDLPSRANHSDYAQRLRLCQSDATSKVISFFEPSTDGACADFYAECLRNVCQPVPLFFDAFLNAEAEDGTNGARSRRSVKSANKSALDDYEF